MRHPYIAAMAAQSSIVSFFIAATESEFEKISREDAELAERELWERHAIILATLIRQKDELEAVLRRLDPNEQKPFCELLSNLLVGVAFTGGFRQFRDRLLRERREAASAVKVLSSFCERLHREGLVDEKIFRFVDTLHRLDEMSEFITIHDVEMVSWVVPNSRKAGGDFFGGCISHDFS